MSDGLCPSKFTLKKEKQAGERRPKLCPKSLSVSLQQQRPGRVRALGRWRAWGRIRTDIEGKKNAEGDVVLERQKCEHRGREIRRGWWAHGGGMRGRVASERNARDKAGRRGKKTGEKRD